MKKVIILFVASVFLFSTSQCKKDEDDKVENGNNQPGQQEKVIELEATDQMEYNKTEISAKKGQEVKVKLTAISALPAAAMSHNFVLLKSSADPAAVAQACSSSGTPENDYIAPVVEDDIIANTPAAAGGETVEVSFTAPEDIGEYDYICTFSGHSSTGKGVLTIEE